MRVRKRSAHVAQLFRVGGYLDTEAVEAGDHCHTTSAEFAEWINTTHSTDIALESLI